MPVTVKTRIGIDDNDSFALGGESLKVSSKELREYVRWIIAKDGRPHPRVCSSCGSILRRTPIPAFKLRRKDPTVSTTYDGYYVFSHSAAEALREILGATGFHSIPSERGFRILDWSSLPVLAVDRTASGCRESEECSSCGRPYYQLYGLTPGRPPIIKPLVLCAAPARNSLFRSDMEFGSTHGRSPALFFHPEHADELRAAGINARKVGQDGTSC